MKTLTRADLEDAAYRAVEGLRLADARTIVYETFRAISKALIAGETVKISGFAVFAPMRRAARVARNPKRPAEEHLVPPRIGVRFKAAHELKAEVKRGPKVFSP